MLAARRAQIGASSAPAATSSSVWQASLGLAAEAAWPTGFPQGGTALGATVVDIARRFIGDRYVWGGHAPGGFDCTGLTWYVYRQAGVDIPNHDLAGQLAAGQPVPRSQLQAGDLVFFENTYQPGLSHVGIALGDGRFLHAMSEQHGVTISSLDEPYWSQRYYGASRPGSMGGQL